MSDIIKTQSFALACALKKLGIRLPHGKALDVMAQVHGANSWNHFIAQTPHPEAATASDAELVHNEAQCSPEDQALAMAAAAEYDRMAGSMLQTGEQVEILVAGDQNGTLRHSARIRKAAGGLTSAKVRLLLQIEKAASLRYLVATLEGQDGPSRIVQIRPLAFDELASTAFTVELRTFAASKMLQCPLTGRVYYLHRNDAYPWRPAKTAFLPGAESPILPNLVPSNFQEMTQTTQETPVTVTFTVGQVVASYWQHQERAVT